MEERVGEAFAGTEQLTIRGRQLQRGDPAPDFRLDYLDLADLVVRTISLADATGMVRLLSVVNSLGRPLCQLVTHQWEASRAIVPSDACIYTVSRDSPQMQAQWQETTACCTRPSRPIAVSSSAPTMACGSKSGVSYSEASLEILCLLH
jgi:thioredoxin-dependent peroxiredoxin